MTNFTRRLRRRAGRNMYNRALPAIRRRRAAADAYVDRLNTRQRHRLRFHRQYSPTSNGHRYNTPNMMTSHVMQAAGTIRRAARRFLINRAIRRATAIGALSRRGMISDMNREISNFL